jgi:hypothetical protein
MTELTATALSQFGYTMAIVIAIFTGIAFPLSRIARELSAIRLELSERDDDAQA